ncbi:hypothetical protein EDF62_2031 [Leucobacter luti]|uniref:Uncharacterized protein n=1 Tax=Leucobacter luti TaxID=340320 RepID=A0A4R6RYS5_9MICO|nr:hypothetical protein EDF62_2031 [Leucobacter luti]
MQDRFGDPPRVSSNLLRELGRPHELLFSEQSGDSIRNHLAQEQAR